MITENDFKAINEQVIAAINEAYDKVEQNHPEYITFLADGDYIKPGKKNPLNLNPYWLDYKGDYLNDKTRHNFMIQFLQNFYRFNNEARTVEDSEIRMNMEMMIYSQSWEAKPVLKKLDRLVRMAAGHPYQWKLNIPPMGKHNFIRATKVEAQKAGLALWDVLNNCYHSQIRNAFAHSDYSIDEHHKHIWLYNYENKKWQLQSMTFDEWSRRFSYSILFVYHLIHIHFERRAALPAKHGTNEFKIHHPSEKVGSRQTEIVFHPDTNMFRFKHPKAN